ncbi:MAG: hypothetical protein Q8914_06185 [Bacteroidota bacterium]|nr:hypothetical protein [Bacteroidota bacterium]
MERKKDQKNQKEAPEKKRSLNVSGNTLLSTGALVLIISLVYWLLNLNHSGDFFIIWIGFIAIGIVLCVAGIIIKCSSGKS